MDTLNKERHSQLAVGFEQKRAVITPKYATLAQDYVDLKTIEEKQTKQKLSAKPLSTKKGRTVPNHPRDVYQPRDGTR